MKRRHLILIGIAAFLVSLIVSAPAALLYSKLPHRPGNIELSGIDGTLIDGGASALLLGGQPLLSGLQWHFRPAQLLLGRAAFALESSGALSVSGSAAQLITGGLNIDHLRAAGALKSLLALSGNFAVPIKGQFGLKLDSARIRNNFIKSAEGEVTVNALTWTLSREPALLGDFLARISTDKAGISAKLSPLSGPLDVGGELRVRSDRSYEIDIQVKAKPDAPPLIQNLLHSLGQPDTAGYQHIRSTGNLGGGPAAAG